MMTGDEKWVLYDNLMKRRKSWVYPSEPSTAKPNIHAKTVAVYLVEPERLYL